MPNALGQNAPMEEGKINQCNEAFSTDAFDENLPVHYGNLHEPLPEITTNNSSKITSYISTENSSHQPIYEKDTFYLRDGMEEGCKKIKSYKSCLEELRESTGYNEHMKLGNKITAKTFDEIIKVLADVMVLNAEDTVTINQTKLPAYVVQERFKELDSSHMEYLVNALSENESKIRNVRAFILTAAYNAPSNMDAYYTALVSYDMREGGY
ncbi:putative conjugative transposon protein [Streptococcus pneumoniae]|nr:putative conjugative transposon protein [Streptococcus pneumoniae]VJN50788.1 putative transposon protein [Streptococcus pneumoniae]VJW24172.1 putative conjugative transposon protein [Streptococcus pneumoniae]VKC12092.1 putative transposon protein [Streptococcus pneumoniae]VKJ81796.1 putative transposon protein [Streptococcus pneumoniae]